MILKTDKQPYFFEVELKQTVGRSEILTAMDVKSPIEIATAPQLTGGYARYMHTGTFIFRGNKQLIYDNLPGHCRKKKFKS